MFSLLLLFLQFLLCASSCPPGWQPGSSVLGKCYLFGKQNLIWQDAENYCKNATTRGHLISIKAAFENTDIFAKAQYGCAQYWIGLNDVESTGQFVWSDRQAVQYTNWDSGQPITGDSRDCVSYNGQTNGKWVTETCGRSFCFVCESYPPPDTTTPPITATTTSPKVMTDCYDWLHFGGETSDGIYQVTVPGATNPVAVWCDMTTDGGGWTVIHRRLNGNLSFDDKISKDYKYGFNDGLDRNLWLGNEYIHLLSTKDSNVELRIDIWGDRTPNSQYSNIYLWQKQSSFYLDSYADYYTLHASTTVEGNASVAGSANAGINYNIGQPFSTLDDPQDDCNGCCTYAPNDLGGWWLYGCSYSSLNGKYIPSNWGSYLGYSWYTGNYYINPVHSTMMLRRAP